VWASGLVAVVQKAVWASGLVAVVQKAVWASGLVAVVQKAVWASGLVPVVQKAVWASGPIWTSAENVNPTGIRSSDHPARGESLCRLSYLGPQCCKD
jgi:precorrin isomerase